MELLPLDSEFDKLLNCEIADMRNITNSRGAGSITAAQFLKDLLANSMGTPDIAGVTWSKKIRHFQELVKQVLV